MSVGQDLRCIEGLNRYFRSDTEAKVSTVFGKTWRNAFLILSEELSAVCSLLDLKSSVVFSCDWPATFHRRSKMPERFPDSDCRLLLFSFVVSQLVFSLASKAENVCA